MLIQWNFLSSKDNCRLKKIWLTSIKIMLPKFKEADTSDMNLFYDHLKDSIKLSFHEHMSYSRINSSLLKKIWLNINYWRLSAFLRYIKPIKSTSKSKTIKTGLFHKLWKTRMTSMIGTVWKRIVDKGPMKHYEAGQLLFEFNNFYMLFTSYIIILRWLSFYYPVNRIKVNINKHIPTSMNRQAEGNTLLLPS